MHGRMRDYSQSPVRRLVARRYISDSQPMTLPIKNTIPKGINPAHTVKHAAIQARTILQQDFLPTQKIQKSTPAAVRIPGLPVSPQPVVVPVNRNKAKPAKPRQSRSQVLLRNALSPPQIVVNNSTHHKKAMHKKKKLKTVSIMVMASIVFMSGIYASWHTWSTNRAVVAQVQGATSTNNNEAAPTGETEGEVPDETEVTAAQMNAHKVGPNLPRFINIEKLGVHSRVKRMGLTKDGALEAPNNIYDAGWYEGSAKPGDPKGATLIDGHVYGPSKSAIFSRLDELKDGDVIDIERGDGLHVRYQVVARDVYDRETTDMVKATRAFDPTKPGLNIVTCHGKYDTKAKTYKQRLVVYAVQI